jgi:hypothetical protein
MGGIAYMARTGERRVSYRGLVGKPEGKRLLGSAMIRWKDNTRMDLIGLGWEGVDWIGLA